MHKEEVTESNLLQVLELLDKSGIAYWLDGGWGVDVLAGKQTREHHDIDIDFDASQEDMLLKLLLSVGYSIATDERPTRMELYSDKLGYLDIHPFIVNEDGTSKQADPNGGFFEFPAGIFAKTEYEGLTVPCISLEAQKLFHTGYELRDKDMHDLALLNQIES